MPCRSPQVPRRREAPPSEDQSSAVQNVTVAPNDAVQHAGLRSAADPLVPGGATREQASQKADDMLKCMTADYNSAALYSFVNWYTDVTNMHSCSIYESPNINGQELDLMTGRLVKYLENHPEINAVFPELVADYIRGEDGQWFFLQVKAFKYERPGSSLCISPRERSRSPESKSRRARPVSGRSNQSSKSTRSRTAGGGGQPPAQAPEPASTRAVSNNVRQQCKGDYCNTLRRAETEEGYDLFTEALSKFRYRDGKGFDGSIPAEAKRAYAQNWIADRGLGDPAADDPEDDPNYHQMHAISLQKILMDREERSAKDQPVPPGKWSFLENAQWHAHSPENTLLLERAAVRERAEHVKLFVEKGTRAFKEAPMCTSLHADLNHMCMFFPDAPSRRMPIRREPPLHKPVETPDPHRTGRVNPHDKYASKRYNMVNVCHDCYRVYLQIDRRRVMGRLL
ncbi:hypothetical protein CYMTET_34230 [Cymbomonas tetramitiformis]|uniref:Uncharacterized protein n=1 Tax=Cymbomonas tetramitiformis TaxID=36881 RepID=A0AAE0FC24_9CHLO|nr:hypothetical protein CYMTET_34230 [Cymbomonas tetramitiformis]